MTISSCIHIISNDIISFFLWLNSSPLYICIISSWHACMLSLQSCLTLWHLMDCSLPGSSIHEMLQARILEWVVDIFFRNNEYSNASVIMHYSRCWRITRREGENCLFLCGLYFQWGEIYNKQRNEYMNNVIPGSDKFYKDSKTM